MPHHPDFNNPKHWRDRAEEARALAEQMHDDLSKQMMLGIAKDYEKLATRVAQRLASDSVVDRAMALIGRSKT